MINCKHNLSVDTCAICSGYLDKVEKERIKYRDKYLTRKQFNIKRQQLQDESKEFGIRHKELYTDEELKYVIENTKSCSKIDIDVLYNIAKHIKRRFGAIEWLWNYIYDEKATDYLLQGKENKLYIRLQNLKEKLHY